MSSSSDPTTEGKIKGFHPGEQVPVLQDNTAMHPRRQIQPVKARSPPLSNAAMNHSLAQPRSHGHMQPPRKGGRWPPLATRRISTKTHPGPPPVVQIQRQSTDPEPGSRTAAPPRRLQTAVPLAPPHRPPFAPPARGPCAARTSPLMPVGSQRATARIQSRRRLNAPPHGSAAA